jgi:pseudouridine kinase
MPATTREQEILDLLRADPRLKPTEIARRLKTSRAAVAVHLSALSRKGLVQGRGYILADEPYLVAIGGANMDLKTQMLGPAVMASSNPARATMGPGGVARNIAHNLALLDHKVTLLSAVGEDELGRRLMTESAAAAIDVHHVLRLPEPTGLYAASLDQSGELILAGAAMAIMERLTLGYLASHEQLIAGAQMIVADDNLPAESLAWLAELAARRGLRLAIASVSAPKADKIAALLDRAWPLFALFGNRDEVAALTHQPLSDDDEIKAALRSLHGRGIGHIAVSLGRAGVLVSSRMAYGVAYRRLPPSDSGATIADVTGAGDAAVAGTIHGLLGGLDLARAAALGQAAAALTLSCEGSVNPALNGALLEQSARASLPVMTDRRAAMAAVP